MNNEMHRFTLGSLGAGYKSITFKKTEFKSELAPRNSKITYWEINGEEMVTMIYGV